jgi:hypothetical protein
MSLGAIAGLQKIPPTDIMRHLTIAWMHFIMALEGFADLISKKTAGCSKTLGENLGRLEGESRGDNRGGHGA